MPAAVDVPSVLHGNHKRVQRPTPALHYAIRLKADGQGNLSCRHGFAAYPKVAILLDFEIFS